MEHYSPLAEQSGYRRKETELATRLDLPGFFALLTARIDAGREPVPRRGAIGETQNFPLVRSVLPGNLPAFDWGGEQQDRQENGFADCALRHEPHPSANAVFLMPGSKRILFPVDFSDSCLGTARYVEFLAGQFEAGIMLLTLLAWGTQSCRGVIAA
jgi:hypothetical protein